MMIGRIDEIDGHFIATRFIAMIIPAECLYISSVGRPSRPDSTATTRQYPRAESDAPQPSRNITPIRFEWRSVGLAYARVWFPVMAIAIPLIQLVLGVFSAVTWLVSVALIVVCFAAHRSGHLSEREKARLRVLGTVTGLRIDPAKLRENTRNVKRDSLGDLMDKAGIPLASGEIIAVLEDIPMPALPLVYGYACYAGDDPEWRSCAEAIYARYEAGEI
jgi:hypothetical protein